MDKLFCISAGQLLVKKAASRVNKKNRYLNYGLLSLATELKKAGYDPMQIHGNFNEPFDTVEQCIEYGLESSNLPVLISIPSFYAVSWVAEFVYLIKTRNKEQKIILGGRWVIANRVELMKKEIPDADIIISGLANDKIVNIVKSVSSNIGMPANISIKNSSKGKYPSLDYSILSERSLYNPSIEVSRGCGMGCSFCQEKDEKINPLKSAKNIVKEAESIIISDDLPPMNLYFEASMFIPNEKWIKDLIYLKNASKQKFKWRAEARVDTINPKLVPLLAQSGMKILDLGLESACETQLLRMAKTKDPEKYLLRASTLLKEAYKYNIDVKINILLTAGETEKSILTTINWLTEHKAFIKGVSVGPVIIFGWEEDTKDYIKYLTRYGASESHSPGVGIVHLNLSKEINYERSIEISKEITNKFMSKTDYYYLKSFSYFARNYTYKNFLSDC